MAAASKTSQGEGEQYADPGYTDEGKKYPVTKDGKLDDGRIRAAYSYICQKGNQKPYTASQVKAIMGRIMAAGKKIGIKYEDDSKTS